MTTKKKSAPALPIIRPPLAASTNPEPPAPPTIPDHVVPLKNALVGMYEALEEGSRVKFATQAVALIGALVPLSGGDLDKLDDADVPVEFFAHLPAKLRNGAVLKLVDALMEEGKEKFA